MDGENTRDSVIFYRSFYEAVAKLPAEQFSDCVKAIIEYGLYGKEPQTEGIEKTVFLLSKPQIDANNARYHNGKKGGRPQAQKDAECMQKGTEAQKVFRTPTREEIKAYCAEREYDFDADKFADFYESNGWMVGKNKMKDWKAAVRSWARRDREKKDREKHVKSRKFNDFPQRDYDFEELEKALNESAE